MNKSVIILMIAMFSSFAQADVPLALPASPVPVEVQGVWIEEKENPLEAEAILVTPEGHVQHKYVRHVGDGNICTYFMKGSFLEQIEASSRDKKQHVDMGFEEPKFMLTYIVQALELHEDSTGKPACESFVSDYMKDLEPGQEMIETFSFSLKNGNLVIPWGSQVFRKLM